MRDLTIDEIKEAIDRLVIPNPTGGTYEGGWNAALGTLRDDLRSLSRTRSKP